VFAASLKSSLNGAVNRTFAGDLAITTGGFGGGALSPRLATELAALPEVRAAAGLGRGVARIDGQDEAVTIADPGQLAQVLDLHVVDGALGAIGNGVAVSASTASSHHWSVGSAVGVTFTDGTSASLPIGAIYDEDDVPGPYIVPRTVWAPHAVQDLDATVYVALTDGVGVDQGKAAVEQVTDGFGHPNVLGRSEYVAESTQGINIILGLVYVMLALAVVIALLGIANTLSLSIFERTRELGLLRAVGASRARLRSMVRWESVIIALFGTIGGLGVGLFLGWALTVVAVDVRSAVFTAPVTQLLVVLVAGGVAGVLAAVRPARRAARLDVLAAIASE
jgi:putative ABC transport system permease protein